ncbi:MAG: arylsulfatase [Planctomycetota bacterium]|nr:arylsulfatase [Planctomycetota bacterium]
MLTAAAFAGDPPNIVFILLDDAGYGDVSCFGQKKFATPNVDALAAGGMKFTQHYSGSTVCAPTRCCLMTGYHTGHAYVRGNREVKPVGQAPIPAETVTVAELMQGAGYKVGAFGKWGLGSPGSDGDPVHQGFDVFYGYNCQRNAHSYYPSFLFHNLDKVELDGKTYSQDLIMGQALDFIRANKDGPFFCYLPWTIPHAAMHVPESYAAPFREQFAQFEEVIGRYKGPPVKNPVAAFAGMMVKMDEDVGRVMALLEELGIDENTLVIFSSDNGPHKEGGHKPDFFDSNGPLTGHKRDLTEGGIRVPTIAYWPGKIAAGSSTDLISAHWDFLPTACELAGVEAPEGIDGISYLPTLLGEPDRQRQHDHLYWEFFERGGKRAARFGKWKAVQVNVHKDRNGPIQIFDLEADLAERNNLAEQKPGLVARAKKIFAEAHTPSPHWQWRGSGNKK